MYLILKNTLKELLPVSTNGKVLQRELEIGMNLYRCQISDTRIQNLRKEVVLSFAVLFHFRSWDKVFCVLDGKRLAMYKDQKHAKTVSTMGRVHK